MKRLLVLVVGLVALAATLALEVHGSSPVEWVYAAPSASPGPTTGAATPSPGVTQVPPPQGFYEGPASCYGGEPSVAPEWAANRDKARAVAQRYHLEAMVFLWQINQESGFNPQAVSPTGAIGIAQFLPATAAGMHPPVNPWNVDSALDGSMRLDLNELRFYWPRSLTMAERFGGNRNAYVWGLALAAYNAGGRAVNAALVWADQVGWSSPWTWLSAPSGATGWDQGQTSRYVRNILGCW